MLDGGADPLYVGRRLIRMATEDIGLADPRALSLTTAAVETYERLGTPEGELALAEAVIYLACAAKSNAVYVAYGAARAFIAEDGSRPVPLRLRNAPTKLMKGLGYGKGYRYAHDEEERSPPASITFPTTCPKCRGTSRPIAGSRRRSARSWSGCARRTRKRAAAIRSAPWPHPYHPRRVAGRAPALC